jgi:diguanylate cyclase (GGDEF)-like protein
MEQLENRLFKGLRPLMVALTPVGERHNPLQMWRAQCMVVASSVGALVAFLYGVLYYALQDRPLGLGCWLASALIAANLALFRLTGYTRATKQAGVALAYLLLLGIVSRQGGIESPALIWLAACPLIAFASSGRGSGIAWSLLALLAIVGVHLADARDLFPPVIVSDMRLVGTLSTISFMASFAVTLLAYDQVCAAALNRLSRSLARINDLAERDDLTGVFNRRKLISVATSVARRAGRTAAPFCVCMLDIDRFKSINDAHGHAAGDDVLRQFARRIQNEVRATDCFGRYGGEEFLLVLENADADAAGRFSERIRRLVQGMPVPMLDDGLNVTVSIGVAQYRPGELIGQTISRADDALYAAKHGGRNRVMVAGAESAGVAEAAL